MEREGRRPPVPDIPGLHKGKIEAQGEIWASRRRLTFRENRADVFVIAKELEFFLKLPVLGVSESEPKPGEITRHPLWMPRVYTPTGAIYITRWEIQERFDSESAVAFGGRKYVPGKDLPGLPKSWTIAKLIPQRYESIDSAIEAADKIAQYEGILGPEQKRVEELFVALRGISDVFLYEEDISPLRLEGLARQAESLLREHGLLTAKDKVWKNVAGYTMAAVTQVVRYNRPEVNRMISRNFARAAYLAAVHRELRQRAAREKALRIFFYLSEVKADAVSRLESTEIVLGNLGGFAHSMPVVALSGALRWIKSEEALPLENALKALVKNNLAPIEAAPYSQTARLAEAILVGERGKSNKEIEKFKQSLDERGMREFARKSAVEYLMEKDATSTRKRMHQAFNVIHEGLTPPKAAE